MRNHPEISFYSDDGVNVRLYFVDVADIDENFIDELIDDIADIDDDVEIIYYDYYNELIIKNK